MMKLGGGGDTGKVFCTQSEKEKCTPYFNADIRRKETDGQTGV